MHAFFHTKSAQRRLAWDAADRERESKPRLCVMQLTVEVGQLSGLRALVTRTCGDALEFIEARTCASAPTACLT